MVLMMIMVQQMKIMILLFIKNDMLFIDKTTGRGWEVSSSVFNVFWEGEAYGSPR